MITGKRTYLPRNDNITTECDHSEYNVDNLKSLNCLIDEIESMMYSTQCLVLEK